MDDAGQRRQLGLHGGQQAGDLVRIGDIGSDDPELAAVLFAERIEALLRGIAGRAPAGQHQMLGAVRGQVSGNFQPYGSEATGHEICCVRAQFQRRSGWLPNPSDQPGHIDGLFTQRDLVFPGGRLTWRRSHVLDEPRPFVGDIPRRFVRPSRAYGQVRQSAPHLRKLQRGRPTESPQATLIGCHGVRIGDSLRAAGHHPDGSAQLSGDRGTEESPCPAQDFVLHPRQ